MSAAQKKLWAKKKRQAAKSLTVVTKAPVKKRKMSAEARRRIGAATKARWAALKASEAA